MKRTVVVAVVLSLTVVVVGATIRRVFLERAVVATGYLQPATTTQLNFASAGMVTDVFVEVGQAVHAGQVVARQDTAALEAELAAHETALATLLGTQPVSDSVDAAARAQLSAAQAKAEAALATDGAAVASAADAVAAARATLATDQQQITQFASNCAPPEGVVASPAAGASPPITAPPPSPFLVNSCTQLAHRISQDEANLVEAIGAYNEAISRREATASTQNAAVIAAARDVEAANSRAALSGGSATAALAQQAAAVAASRAALAGAVLVAPADGVITSVGGAPGEIAGPEGVRVFGTPQALPQKDGTGIALFPQPAQQPAQPQSQFRSMLTLDSTAMSVVAQVGEEDLDVVTVRRRATVTFPALPDQSYVGVVTGIEPRAVNADGKVYFLVEIGLSEQPSTVFRLRQGSGARPSTAQVSGLTANVRF